MATSSDKSTDRVIARTIEPPRSAPSRGESLENAGRAPAGPPDAGMVDLLAAAAHDLRAPLSVVIAAAVEIRTQTESEDPYHRQLLELIERNGRQAVEMADRLLRFLRIREAGVELETVPVDLSRLMNDAVEQARRYPVAEGKGVTWLPGGCSTPVHGDPLRLGEVLSNLLLNALRFAESHVFVSCNSTRRWVRVDVEDDGPGIPDDLLEAVFEPWRTRASEPVHRSTGLGLAIVRSIVEAHDGRVSAHNVKRAGRVSGARFTVRLPRTYRHSTK